MVTSKRGARWRRQPMPNTREGTPSTRPAGAHFAESQRRRPPAGGSRTRARTSRGCWGNDRGGRECPVRATRPHSEERRAVDAEDASTRRPERGARTRAASAHTAYVPRQDAVGVRRRRGARGAGSRSGRAQRRVTITIGSTRPSSAICVRAEKPRRRSPPPPARRDGARVQRRTPASPSIAQTNAGYAATSVISSDAKKDPRHPRTERHGDGPRNPWRRRDAACEEERGDAGRGHDPGVQGMGLRTGCPGRFPAERGRDQGRG